jgi:hypothetical protein
MMKIEGSISQRHGSADPDPVPHQNFMDSQQWCMVSTRKKIFFIFFFIFGIIYFHCNLIVGTHCYTEDPWLLYSDRQLLSEESL